MSDNFVSVVIYGMEKTGGEKFPIRIEIGKPYISEKYDVPDWICSISPRPLLRTFMALMPCMRYAYHYL